MKKGEKCKRHLENAQKMGGTKEKNPSHDNKRANGKIHTC